MNTDELKKPAAKRIFRGWIEDWETDLLMKNDPVAEAQLLEKYKGLVFMDPNYDTTYTIHDKNLEFQRRNRRKKIDGGWTVIAVDENNENEGYVIEQDLIDMILDHAQAPDIEIVLKENNEDN